MQPGDYYQKGLHSQGKQSIEFFRKALSESKAALEKNSSPEMYTIFLDTSIKLSQLDLKRVQHYLKDALSIAEEFLSQSEGDEWEPHAHFLYAKIVSGLKEVEKETLEKATESCEIALENLENLPEQIKEDEIILIKEEIESRLEEE